MSLPFRQIENVFGPAGPAVIVEIGAADGLDTIQYVTRYPKTQILVFEPLKRNVEKLQELPARYPTVAVYACALGKEPRLEADFWISGGTPPNKAMTGPWPYSSSLLEPAQHRKVHPWCTFTKETTSVCRLDTLLRRAPSYIHIDVQGAELDVLEGAGVLLDDVKAVWIETADVELYKGQPLRHDVTKFMVDHGFELVGYYGSSISGDQFWKRKS